MTGEQHIRVWSKETGFITLGAEDELGRGGEGTVYSLPDQADLVAKVYHPTNQTERAFRKLEVMIDYFPVTGDRETGHLYVAWPRHIIYDGPAGDAVGFLMPRVERKNSLLDYYIQSYRSTNALHVDYGDLCSVAASLATALAELNGRGYVVGDINESNACITDNQHVTLIDADSFQVLDHDVTPPEVYHCTVGKPEYTPPELQGMSFEEVERTIHHDRFALAVVIYQLLMEGRHPFSGVYSGGGEEPNYEDSISEGYFLYSRSRGVPLASLPRDHILWEALDERLRDLFVRCFDEGHSNPERRPSPREWAAALEETARSLSVCDSNPNHLYSTRQAIVPACPWCERKALTGLDSFPESQTSQAQPEPDPPDTQPSPQTATQPQARGPQPSPATPPATGFRFPARLATVAALAFAVLAIGLCAVYSGESGSGVAPDGTQGQVPPLPPASGGAASFETPVGTRVPVAVFTPKAPNTPIAAAIVPTITPIPTGTSTLTPKPSDTPTPRPTFTHSPTVTPTPTASPTASHTPLPTSTPTPSPTSSPTPLPTATSTPTPPPTPTPLPCTTFLPGSDLSKCDLSGMDMRGLELVGADLSFAVLANVDMTRADLTGAKLIEANLTGANLERAVLIGATISGASVERANFSNADLRLTDISDIRSFNGATLIKTVFPEGAELKGATFVAADLTQASLSGADLERSDFTMAILYRADLSQTVLVEATFRSANLEGTRLDGANLQRAHLVGTDLSKIYFESKPDFSEADLENANLNGAGLDGVDFSGANLEEVRLNRAEMRATIFANANLRRAKMRNASLQGALFIGSDVSDADFSESDLTGASFQDADVEDAEFSESDLTNASFRSAENVETAVFDETRCPDGVISSDCYEERRLRGTGQ